MRTCLLIGLVLLCGSLALACGGEKLPYDPAAAATQVIDPNPTAAPNDAEWKLLHDAALVLVNNAQYKKQSDSAADWMLDKITAKKFPNQIEIPGADWYGRMVYLLRTVLIKAHQDAMGPLAHDPKDAAALKADGEVVTVYNKWATVYNDRAAGNEESLEKQNLPARIEMLDFSK